MLFIGVALLVAAGLVVVIGADAGRLVGLDQTQTAQLIPLLLILVVVAGGVFGRRHRLGELLANIVVWSAIFVVALVGYAFRSEIGQVADRVMGEFSPGVAVIDTEGGTATIRRSLGGSFRVNAAVNGAPTRFIFDTGATAVVLTTSDAAAAGIDIDTLRYSVPVQTANGTGRAAMVMIDRIQIGQIQRGNIRAFVAEPHALETSLLGMTFLETLSSYAVTNDALELRD